MFWYTTAVTVLFTTIGRKRMDGRQCKTPFRRIGLMGGLLMLAYCGPGNGLGRRSDS